MLVRLPYGNISSRTFTRYLHSYFKNLCVSSTSTDGSLPPCCAELLVCSLLHFVVTSNVLRVSSVSSLQ